MSTVARLTGADFDSMVERGAFDQIGPKKVELIHGELRFMNPAGPVHDDYIDYLTRWSCDCTTKKFCTVRVQSGFACDDHRPEPDIFWLQPKRYGATRPVPSNVLLLIEIADSSLNADLREKADLYATAGVIEYWVVDIPNRRVHVMTEIEDNRYRSVEIITPSKSLAPKCKPDAELNLDDLFSV